MANYMLAQLRLKYGYANVGRYNEIMVTVRRLFETQGVLLLHGSITRVGPLYEVWNLWAIEDQGHMARAFATMASDPDGPFVVSALAEVVESEETRFLERLPFAEG